jgi:hypothetical protein
MNMKVAQEVAISIGYFSDSKKSERASKSSPISKKIAQSGQPDLDRSFLIKNISDGTI